MRDIYVSLRVLRAVRIATYIAFGWMAVFAAWKAWDIIYWAWGG